MERHIHGGFDQGQTLAKHTVNFWKSRHLFHAIVIVCGILI